MLMKRGNGLKTLEQLIACIPLIGNGFIRKRVWRFRITQVCLCHKDLVALILIMRLVLRTQEDASARRDDTAGDDYYGCRHWHVVLAIGDEGITIPHSVKCLSEYLCVAQRCHRPQLDTIVTRRCIHP